MIIKLRYWVLLLTICSSCARKYSTHYLTANEILYTETLEKNANDCTDFENYAPDGFSQMHYLRINFHVMRTSDGKENFTESEARSYIKDLVSIANYKLSVNAKMNLPEGNTTPVLPVSYRMVLTGDPKTGSDGIYFHDDDSTCWFLKNKKSGLYSLGDQTPFKYAIGEDSILNIYLIEHHHDSIAANPDYHASTSGASFSHNIKIFGAYYNLKEKDKGTSHYAGLLNHEIGHTLGINHTWRSDDGCDDTPKNPGCWEQTTTPPCDGIISNNMMDYNGCQCAITPCQLAKIHYNFWKEKSSQRTVLQDRWCDYDSTIAIVIPKDSSVVWYEGREFNCNIIVSEGASLTIQCLLALPGDAKIIVKPTGKLIIDGGTIGSRCNALWDGIEIWQSTKFGLSGQVEIRNHGKLESIKNSSGF